MEITFKVLDWSFSAPNVRFKTVIWINLYNMCVQHVCVYIYITFECLLVLNFVRIDLPTSLQLLALICQKRNHIIKDPWIVTRSGVSYLTKQISLKHAKTCAPRSNNYNSRCLQIVYANNKSPSELGACLITCFNF